MERNIFSQRKAIVLRTLGIGLFLIGISFTPGMASSSVLDRGLTNLPLDAQSSISRILGNENPAYHAAALESGYRFKNHQHALSVDLSTSGVEICSDGNRWVMALRAYGYGDELIPAQAAMPRAVANHIEYRRGILTEWYVNGQMGVEQGFTIESAPATRNGEELTLVLALSGDLTATVDHDGAGLTLQQVQRKTPACAGGSTVLRYCGLTACDATGKALRSWMELDTNANASLLIRVDDTGAQYPIVIDPFIQQAKLTATDGAIAESLGFSASISGNTVVIGAPWAAVGANAAQGSVYVFVKPDSGWADVIQTAKLTASDGEMNDWFGWAVAISGDAVVVGSRLGNVGANVDQGSAYVFVKPEGGWAACPVVNGIPHCTETAKLIASDGAANDWFGSSVAIDGNTIVVGARADDVNANVNQGSAYVFVKPEGGWAGNLTESAKLTASDGVANDALGEAAGISVDTVVVTAPYHDIGVNGNQGSAYVFVKPGGGWAGNLTESAKLSASDGSADDMFGWGAEISSDTVVVGAPSDDPNGSAYVFVKPGGGWTGNLAETAKLTASDGAVNDAFGDSVTISGDTVAVGAWGADIGANEDQGAVYVFVKPDGGWVNMNETGKVIASDGAAHDFFGEGLDISDSVIVVGASGATVGENPGQGAAYVFYQGGVTPLAPILKSPKKGAQVTTLRPTLRWNISNGATQYNVEVYKNRKSGKAFDKATVSATKYKTKKLIVGKKYFWRVQACNDNGCSVWSAWRWFTVTTTGEVTADE